ncbi:MAG: hypothetical protein HFE25_06210 [Clostridia bacterium]|jgi:hypothetical protein|nr:hypothetical protein [Clostridia bacterium]
MNHQKMITKYFDFLLGYNFTKKKFTNGTDNDICYRNRKSNITIIIYFDMVISEDIFNLNDKLDSNDFDKQIELHSHFDVWLTVEKNGENHNVLSCKLFDSISRETMVKNITNCKDMGMKLKIYSDFIKSNLNQLL